jgi:hypothetical protein
MCRKGTGPTARSCGCLIEKSSTAQVDSYVAPAVSVAIENRKIVVKWCRIDSSYFKGYRVVISNFPQLKEYRVVINDKYRPGNAVKVLFVLPPKL